MRKLVILLGALALGWVTPVEAAPAPVAPLGNQFCMGLTTPGQLADIAADALVKDPKGLTMLDPVRCNRPKPARPIDYLEMFKIDDPGAGLTNVSQLPDYLRSLVVQDAPTGKFLMACLKPVSTRTSTTGWAAEHNCIGREFKPGEKAWVNPRTGKGVLASDCTNPIGLPEKAENCAYIDVWTNIPGERPITAIRLKGYKKAAAPELDGECAPMMLRAGTTDYESPWLEECPEALCNFAYVDAHLGQFGFVGGKQGSYKPEPGKHRLRVPRVVAEAKLGDIDYPYEFTFCVERWDGDSPRPPKAGSPREAFIAYQAAYDDWVKTHSCGTNVNASDFVDVGGTMIATVYATEALAKSAGTKTTNGEPTQKWWHWQDKDGQCVPQ